MGQCFPLPDDENVREGMQRHAENYQKIYNMYNFDVVPKPGSDMDKAQKLWDKKQVRLACAHEAACKSTQNFSDAGRTCSAVCSTFACKHRSCEHLATV